MARKRKKREGVENSAPMDMTPMIDCIFLLLIFFMLTTKFTPDEKAIASILPTDKGQSGAPSSVKPPEEINIKIFPHGMGKDYQPSEYMAMLIQQRAEALNGVLEKAVLQIGGEDIMELQGRTLSQPDGSVRQHMDAIHAYIGDKIASRDAGGGQPAPIVIHCFSGLSWKYALAAYDAVRGYEAKRTGSGPNKTLDDIQNAREVSFAPPRVRNYTANEEGNELYEIIHTR